MANPKKLPSAITSCRMCPYLLLRTNTEDYGMRVKGHCRLRVNDMGFSRTTELFVPGHMAKRFDSLFKEAYGKIPVWCPLEDL